jgi:hypothetical protein
MLTLLDVNALTNKWIVPKTTDVIFKQSPVFTRLHTKRMERFEGGLQIQRPIIFNELNGGAVGRGEQFDISFVPTDTALYENIKLYYTNISLYGFDDILNRGPMAVFSQVESKMQNASLKMAKMLAQAMYNHGQDLSGSGGTNRLKELNGLAEWYDDGNTFATVGGLSRADIMAVGTVGGLNAYVNSAVNVFSLDAINLAYTRSWFGSDHVDMIVTTVPGWTKFWSAIQPSQRYMDDKSDLGAIGFQSFRFNASEVVIDQYLPDQTMYGINSAYVEWYISTNPRFQFGFTGFKENQQSIDVAGQFLFAGNIMVPNPRTGFKLSGAAL